VTWFERLTGFAEEAPDKVRAKLSVDGRTLKSLVNGSVWTCGELETPSLAELRERVRACGSKAGQISLREIVANVQALHADPSNAGALFQVASQFNLLEMVSPNVTPEQGVGIYEHDYTQGPACAIAAGAGTIYRNYFALVNGRTGQSADNQIDCLADVGAAMGNSAGQLWKMENGYALAARDGLLEISKRLRAAGERETDQLRQKLRIGIHWDTQVTLNGPQQLVTQAYCSALPVAYSPHASGLWAEFACLVLDAAYEATICTAILNAQRNGNNRVFLTMLGGGAFGNEPDWIIGSIRRALNLYANVELEVVVVSYRASNPDVQDLISSGFEQRL